MKSDLNIHQKINVRSWFSPDDCRGFFRLELTYSFGIDPEYIEPYSFEDCIPHKIRRGRKELPSNKI